MQATRPPSGLPLSSLSLAAVLLTLAVGCAGPTGDRPPNVLLISLDALRADHLSSYGYERETSPFLDQLASRGTRFTQAFVNTHGTPPSHTTILTSLYQQSHRVSMRPSRTEPRNDVVPEGLTMVQEILGRSGYLTVAVTDNGYMSRTFGFARGFGRFFSRRTGIERGHKKLLEFLREVSDDDRPIFALFHTYQIHSPYSPPDEYRDLFGHFESDFEPTSENLFPIQNRARAGLKPGDLEFLQAMYDGEIRYTDDVLRRLFGELEALGFLDNCLVIITSDHGEEFADHGGLLHRVSLFEELLHVPLILFGAGVPPGIVDDRIVSSIDITPTILAAARLEKTEIMAGKDLLASQEESASHEDIVFSQYSDILYSARTRRWKLIESRRGRRLRLYDLLEDPEEKRNLARKQIQRARRMHGRLRQWRKSCPRLENLVSSTVEITPEEAEQLRALGYVD